MSVVLCTYLATGGGYVEGVRVLGARLEALHPGVARVCVVPRVHTLLERERDAVAEWWGVLEMAAVAWPAVVPSRVEWPVVLGKLRVWALPYGDRVVYLDADCWPVEPLTALFEAEPFAACAVQADGTTGGGFNSGVMVLTPNVALSEQMVQEVGTVDPRITRIAKDGEQSYLNWRQRQQPFWTTVLPYEWNVRHFDYWQGEVKIAHLRPCPWLDLPRTPQQMPYVKAWRALAARIGRQWMPMPGASLRQMGVQ